jgi:hypothetical protein
MSHLDPVAERSISFLFPRCQAHLDGADLVVAVPAPALCKPSAEAGWGAPVEVLHGVTVECEPGPRRRGDRREYPRSPGYAHKVLFRFRGAVTYGRSPSRDGWVLSVQGVVRSLTGLPFKECDAVLVEPRELSGVPRPEGPLNGPHLPYP